MRQDLSHYTGDQLTQTWRVSFGEAGYFIEERLGEHPAFTIKRGPVPTIELAYDLVQERTKVIQESVARMILRETERTR
jgi:hypothetical protein